MTQKPRHFTCPRRPRGEQNGRAKLTAEAVRELRRARRAGVSLWTLARRHGVSISTISRAASGLTWSHLTQGGDDE